MKQENFNWREDSTAEYRCNAAKLQWWPQCTTDTTEEEPGRQDEGEVIEMGDMQSQPQGDEERKSLLEHTVEAV